MYRLALAMTLLLALWLTSGCQCPNGLADACTPPVPIHSAKPDRGVPVNVMPLAPYPAP